jgi:mannitol operon transcriptional antiterminator
MFEKLISCLSSNSKKVLAALLNQADSISAQHLADSLNLSISQVRYSIKKIQACLAFSGIEILQKPNEGILINLKAQEKQKILDLIQGDQEDFGILNQNERVQLLIQIILTSGADLTPAEIREATEISYTSFYRDIDKVRAWLESFSLELVAKRNAPFHLAGEELKIREAIQEILFQNLGQDFLVQACILPVEDVELGAIERSLFFHKAQRMLKEMELPLCERQIRELEKKYSRNLFDRTHIELTLYLGIMKNRIRTGMVIKNAPVNKDNERMGYASDARKILDDVHPNQAGLDLDAETQYLANLLSQCFIYGANDSGGQRLNINTKGSHSKLSRAVVHEIAKYLHAGLYEDKELTGCIEWELDHNADQRGFAETAGSFPKISASRNSTEQILSKILTPILAAEQVHNIEEIIMAISNHTLAALERVRSSSFQRRVLLVCGAGIATAFSLRSQLNTLLPEIDVVEMVSVFELAHDSALIEGCDAIISTIPLGNITSVPQIKVNSLLTEEDIAHIRRTLELDSRYPLESAPPFVKRQSGFNEILDSHTIQTAIQARQPAEVIEAAGRLLLKVDAIWPSYINAMKNLYSLYGAYMVIAPNTALLHAGPEMGSKKLAISLITLEKPIAFGHKLYDPVKIALAFSSPVNSVHTDILSHVFSFFALPENRTLIANAGSAEQILSILKSSQQALADPVAAPVGG